MARISYDDAFLLTAVRRQNPHAGESRHGTARRGNVLDDWRGLWNERNIGSTHDRAAAGASALAVAINEDARAAAQAQSRVCRRMDASAYRITPRKRTLEGLRTLRVTGHMAS